MCIRDRFKGRLTGKFLINVSLGKGIFAIPFFAKAVGKYLIYKAAAKPVRRGIALVENGQLIGLSGRVHNCPVGLAFVKDIVAEGCVKFKIIKVESHRKGAEGAAPPYPILLGIFFL